jgi:nucleoside-triphosphatase THEP1
LRISQKQKEIKKIILEKLHQAENKEIDIKLRYAKNDFGYSPSTLKNTLDILKKEKIIKIEKIGSKGGLKLKLHIKEKILQIQNQNNNFINNNFLGREKDILILNSEIKKKNNLLIFGKAGIGKTTLIKEIFKEKNIVYADYTNSVKDLYKILANKIIDINFTDEKEKKEIEQVVKNYNIKNFQHFLSEQLKNNNNNIVIIDNINTNINKNFLGVMQILKQYSQIILILRVETLNNLTNTEILWSLKKIEVKRLDKPTIKILLENLIKDNNLVVINKSNFFRKLGSNSKGNLIALLDMLKQLKNEGIIDFEKINNISHNAEARYFDLTYLILLFIIFAVVLRILGRSNQNNDYVLVGSVLLYSFMFIRIFLFKMIK